jgi:hypothetical protein
MKKAGTLIFLFAIAAFAKLATFGGFGTIAKTGQGTMSLTQGDINGDGIVDWVVESSGAPMAVINQRFGTVQTKRIRSSVYTPRFFALGDVDGDKRLDILVCGEADYHEDREDSATMSVIFAGSDLGFQDSVDVFKGDPVTCARFLDVDLDGDLDIIAVNWSLQWFENKNKGKSWAVHTIETDLDSGNYSGDGSNVWLQVADFDRDSAADFAVGYEEDGEIDRLLYYRNNANGTFTKKVIAYDFSSECAAVGDLDLDGRPDLLVGTAIFRNNRGNFTRDSLPDPPAHHINGESIGDVNNDGYPDIVAGVFDDGVFLWQSAGKGVYVRSLFPSSAGAKIVSVADADADRFADVVALFESTGLYAARNLVTHAFAETTLVAIKGLKGFEFVDLNKDGLNDLVTSPFKIYQRQVRTISAAQKDTILVFIDSSNFAPASYDFADFDKDGILDIANMGGSGMSWAKQADLSHFTYNDVFGINKQPMGIGDLDGNGAVDFVGRYFSSAVTPSKSILIALFNDGTGALSRSDTLFSLCWITGAFPMALSDFDKDGDIDIITVSREQNMQKQFEMMYGKNKGNGDFDSSYVDFGNGSDIDKMTPFDIDKDGWIDLLLASDSLAVSRNRSGSFNGVMTIGAGGTENNEISAGDIDKDGKNDLVLLGSAAKDLTWVTQDTAWGFISKHSISTGKVVGNVRVMDYDNDGWQDVLCVQADKLVMYRNLLGAMPAAPIKPPTGLTYRANNRSVEKSIMQPLNLGRGKFAWRIPLNAGTGRIDFYLMNGERLQVPLSEMSGTWLADLKSVPGVVVWTLRDCQGKIRGRGMLTAMP